MFFFKSKKSKIDSKTINEVIESSNKLFDEYNKLVESKTFDEKRSNEGIKYSIKEPFDSDLKYSLEKTTVINGDLLQGLQEETFSDKVERLIRERKLTSVQFYKAADIDRKVYSAMRNNKMYQPKKETAIACCFGLKLSLFESEDLLNSAGYALSKSIRRDVIIRFCISECKYTLDDVNAILEAAGEKTLR